MDREKANDVQFLDAEISKIQKSTRTTIPAILPLHDVLRQKYHWYYNWHLNPWSSKIHSIIFVFYLVFIAFFTYSTLVQPYKPTQAAPPFAGLKQGASEIVSKRSQNIKVYDNHDGTEQYIVSSGPLHYKDGETWKDINTQIRPGRGGTDFEMSKSIYQAKFKKAFNDQKIAHISKDGEGFSVTLGNLSWTNASGEEQLIATPQEALGQVTDNTLNYTDAYGPGLDFNYETNDSSLNKKLVIPALENVLPTPTPTPTPSETVLPTPAELVSPTPTPETTATQPAVLGEIAAPNETILQGEEPALTLGMEYELDKDLDILIDGELWNRHKISTKAQTIEFQKDGKTLWGFAPPKAWDSAPPSEGGDGGGNIIDGTLTLTGNGKKLNLTVSFPYEWLKDAQYPVTIDPDTYYGETTNGYIIGSSTASYATAHATSTGLSSGGTESYPGQYKSGATYACFRIFLEFDTSGIDDAMVVSQANLYLTIGQDFSTTDFTLRVHKYNWTSPLAAGTQEADYDGAIASTYDADWRSTSGIVTNTPYASANLDTTWIQKGLTKTKYTILSDHDVAETAPTGLEYVHLYLQGVGTPAYRPYLSITVIAAPVTRYWIDNDGGNWNDTANWSATSGGAGGASVPVAGDTAIFDNAGSTHNGALTIDTAVDVGTLTFGADYTGAITPGSYSITTATAMSLTGTSLTAGAAITASGGLTIAAGKTLDMAGNNLTVTSTFSNSGTLKLTGGEATVSLTNDTDSGTVEYYGTSGPYTTKNLTYFDLKINGAATTFNQYGGAITVNGVFNLAAGTYVQGGNDLTVKHDFTIAATGSTFTKGTGSPAAKLKFLGDLIFTGPATAQNLGAVEIGASPETTDLAADFAADSLTINTGDIFNTNGYEVDIDTGGISITGTLDTTDDVETDGSTITDAGDFTVNVGGTFTKDVTGTRSLVKMDGGATKTLTSSSQDLGDFQTSVATTHIDLQDNLTTEVITLDASTTLDTTVSNRSINATNIILTGTLLANGSTITASGNWDNSAGTFTKGASTVILSGTGSLNTGNDWNAAKVFQNLTLAAASATTTLASSVGVYGTLTVGAGTLDGSASWYGIAMYNSTPAATPLSIGAGNAISRAEIRFNITASTNIPSSTRYVSLACKGDAAAASTCTLLGDVTLNGGLTVTGVHDGDYGILDTGGFSVNQAATWAAVYIGTSGNDARYGKLKANGSAITATGGVIIYASGAGGVNELDADTSAISVAGNWTNGDTFTADSSTVYFTKSSDTQSLNSGGTGAGKAFYHLQHTGAGTLQLVTNHLDVDGNFQQTAGGFNANGKGQYFAGDFSLSNGTTWASGGTTTFNGTTIFTDSTASLVNLDLVSVNGTSVTLASNMKFDTGSISGGTLAVGDFTVTAGGNFTINDSGIVTANTGLIKVGLNWTNYGNLTAGSSTVQFTKTSGTQTIQSSGAGTKSFNNLTHSGAGILQIWSGSLDINGNFTNSAGAGSFDANGLNVNVAKDWNIAGGSFTAGATPGTQTVTFDTTNSTTISGSTTFNNLTMDSSGIAGGKTITFTAGTTQTIASGKTWTLDGAVGNVLTLNSSTPTSAWNFNISAGFTSGDYIDVQDSWSANANKITPGSNVTNSGNNDGWIFNPTAPTIGVPEAASSTAISWYFTDTSSNEQGFKVYDATDPLVPILVATCATPNLDHCDETSLSVNIQYTSRYVVAYNASGESPHSGTAASIYTLADTPASPGVTVNSWDVTNGNSLAVTINLSTNPAATEFAIACENSPEWLQNDGSCGFEKVWKTKAAWDAATTGYLKGLAPDTNYWIYTIARNGNQVETTNSPTNGPNMTAPAQVANLGHAANTTVSITWSWNANATAPDGYNIYEYSGGVCTGTQKATTTHPNTTVAENALSANSPYSRCSRAYRGAVTGQPATDFAAYTSIETPTGITFGAITTASIDVSASGTISNLGLDNSGLYFTAGGGSCAAWTHTNACSDGGLSVNTQYGYKVKARNGDSDETPETGITNKYTYANVPGAPTVDVVYYTSLKVIVNINANPAPTQFALFNETLGQYVQADGSNGAAEVWQNYVAWGGATGVTNTGLSAATTYTYKIKGLNGDSVETVLSAGTSQATPGGPGPHPSPSVSPSVSPTATVTPTGAVTTPSETGSPTPGRDTKAPTAPSNLRATKLGAITLTIAWDAAIDDIGVKGYQVYNAETGILVGTTGNTFFDFSGLTPSSTYKFYVRAYDNVPYYSPNSEVLAITTLESRTEEEKLIEEQGGVVAFLVMGNLPSEVSISRPFTNNVKVTAADVGGKIVKGFSKSIYFSATDPLAKFAYPESHPYTFSSQDAGIHEFAGSDFIFNTAGRQQITVSDYSTKSTAEIKVNSTAATVVQKSATYVEGFFNNPESMSWANIAIAILIAGALIMPTLVTFFANVNNLWPQLTYGFTQLAQILGWRRRRKTWGVIFNSQTGQPIPFALVKLLDKNNRLFEVSVSDSQGRYGFMVKHGIYKIKVSRADFLFPSETKQPSFYERVYVGSEIKISGSDQSLVFNIPLDPHAKSTLSLSLWVGLIRTNHLLQKIRLPLFILGAMFALIMILINYSLIFAVFLGFCLLMILLDLLRLSRVTAAGIVSDVYSRTLAGAIVRIYHKADNHLIETDITDQRGRFKFKVRPGVYYLVGTQPKYIDAKSHLMYLQKGQKKEAISSINIKLRKE